MRRLLLLLATASAALAPVGQAGPMPRHVSVQATGEIKKLGLNRVTVGWLTCRLGRHALLAERFVISDPVRITCANGLLKTIKYAPPTDSTRTAVGASPGTSGSKAAPSVSGGSGVTLGSIVVIDRSTGSTDSARGAIAVLTPNEITVGGLTCSHTPFVFEYLAGRLHVGDVVSLSCKAGSTSGITWSAPSTA